MHRYDPEAQPNAEEWLALDEQTRIALAEKYHHTANVKLPNAKVYSVFHAIVENQIAEGLESVQTAVHRLTHQGLTRHDAIHAIGSVLAEHLFEMMKSETQDVASVAQSRYSAAIERLNASEWRKNFGGVSK